MKKLYESSVLGGSSISDSPASPTSNMSTLVLTYDEHKDSKVGMQRQAAAAGACGQMKLHGVSGLPLLVSNRWCVVSLLLAMACSCKESCHCRKKIEQVSNPR